MALLTQHLLSVNGVTLEVFVGGTEGPVLCSAHPFLVQTEHGGMMAEMSRLVLINSRGSGGSSPALSRQDLSWDQLIDDVEAVRMHLGIEKWCFVGLSGGGNVALRYAQRYPQSLTGIIIRCAAPSAARLLTDEESLLSPVNPVWEDALDEIRPLLNTDDDRGDWIELGEDLQLYRQGAQPVMMWPIPNATGCWRAWCEEFFTFESLDWLSNIRTNTLTLTGGRDPLIPMKHCELMHAHMPNSQLVVFEESGHFPHTDEPDKYREVLQAFITERLAKGY